MWMCSCGFANPDDAPACIACGNPAPASGTGDGAADAEPASETPASSLVQPTSPAAGRAGTQAPDGARPDAYEARDWAAYAPESLLLEDVRTGHVIEVTAPGGILGRAGDFCPDSFSGRVSGVHLVAQRTDAGWTLEFVGRNETSVNAAGTWIPLVAGMPRPVAGGELLKMADMLFRLAVVPAAKPCAADEGQSPAQESAPAATAWFIRCPVCGAMHLVDGPESRMKSCPSCADDFDRRIIARALPVELPVEG